MHYAARFHPNYTLGQSIKYQHGRVLALQHPLILSLIDQSAQEKPVSH